MFSVIAVLSWHYIAAMTETQEAAVTKVRTGDKVRVEAEGVVDDTDLISSKVKIGGYWYPRASVSLVEPGPPQVGDAVNGDGWKRLPVGSVIEDADLNHYFITRAGGLRWAGNGRKGEPNGRAATVRFIPA